MSDKEIKLVLDGVDDAPKAPELSLHEKKEAAPKQVQFSPEEEKMIDEFSKRIDLQNSNVVLQYGAGAQQKIAGFSEKTLEAVRTKDLGEVGQLLANVVTELKHFDEEEEKGLLSVFKKGANKLNAMKARYAKAETNVNEITKILEGHQIQLMKDVATLDQMYELNEDYFKELSMYIAAGERKLKEAREVELPALFAEAQTGNSPMAAQRANDLQSQLNRFEKKLHDLDLTRMVSLQMAPQIRMVQASDTVMVEKIQSTLINTIPLWKSQMVLALGVYHSEQAAKAQGQVTDLTNELLKRNADTLKLSTINVAKATERGIVDVETIRYTNESLISALDEVRNIQREGAERRAKATEELRSLEGELKERLLARKE